MDLDHCFICEGPETPTQKLAQVTSKGYHTLLAYAEAVEDAAILEHMKESWSDRKLRYHFECRRDLYNKSVKVTSKSTRKCRTILQLGLSEV